MVGLLALCFPVTANSINPSSINVYLYSPISQMLHFTVCTEYQHDNMTHSVLRPSHRTRKNFQKIKLVTNKLNVLIHSRPLHHMGISSLLQKEPYLTKQPHVFTNTGKYSCLVYCDQKRFRKKIEGIG